MLTEPGSIAARILADESLSKHKGKLDLSGLASLSDGAVESLSKHERDLNLTGLETLSDAAAKSLSKHEGKINLGSLNNLLDAAADDSDDEATSLVKGLLRLLGYLEEAGALKNLDCASNKGKKFRFAIARARKFAARELEWNLIRPYDEKNVNSDGPFRSEQEAQDFVDENCEDGEDAFLVAPDGSYNNIGKG